MRVSTVGRTSEIEWNDSSARSGALAAERRVTASLAFFGVLFLGVAWFFGHMADRNTPAHFLLFAVLCVAGGVVMAIGAWQHWLAALRGACPSECCRSLASVSEQGDEGLLDDGSSADIAEIRVAVAVGRRDAVSERVGVVVCYALRADGWCIVEVLAHVESDARWLAALAERRPLVEVALPTRRDLVRRPRRIEAILIAALDGLAD